MRMGKRIMSKTMGMRMRCFLMMTMNSKNGMSNRLMDKNTQNNKLKMMTSLCFKMIEYR